MKKVIPSLSPMGWIEAPETALNVMFAHILASDFSQSTIYAGKVVSLAQIVAENQENKINMLQAIETVLQDYFNRFFDTAMVVAIDDGSISPVYTIQIMVTITKSGVTYTLRENINVDNGKLSQVLKQLNA